MISRRALETQSRDLMAQATLTAGEVETLSRGNMHTDTVAKSVYDKRNAREFKAQAVQLFITKVLPATKKSRTGEDN